MSCRICDISDMFSSCFSKTEDNALPSYFSFQAPYCPLLLLLLLTLSPPSLSFIIYPEAHFFADTISAWQYKHSLQFHSGRVLCGHFLLQQEAGVDKYWKWKPAPASGESVLLGVRYPLPLTHLTHTHTCMCNSWFIRKQVLNYKKKCNCCLKWLLVCFLRIFFMFKKCNYMVYICCWGLGLLPNFSLWF